MKKIENELQKGKQFFSKDEFESYGEFLNVINYLEELEKNGVVAIVEKHKESFSGNHLYDFIQCKLINH